MTRAHQPRAVNGSHRGISSPAGQGLAIPPVANPRAIARLEIAGRLLCTRGVQVVVKPDDAYVHAVLRTIQGMPRESQDVLKSHVDWVEEYEATPQPHGLGR